MTTTGEITELLRSWSDGDAAAAEEWLPVLYEELRRLANHFLATERPGHTLQPTALVHEAFLRLQQQHEIRWRSRGHFMAIAGRMMRRILVDHARRQKRRKRGGDLIRVDLEGIDVGGETTGATILSLDWALRTLEATDARKALIVELHFFAGLSIAETAETVGCSAATVSRDWRLAKAWLARELS